MGFQSTYAQNLFSFGWSEAREFNFFYSTSQARHLKLYSKKKL